MENNNFESAQSGQSNAKIWSVYIITCLIWGSTWLAIKISLESVTPLISAGLRFLTAPLLIFILLKIKNIKIQTDKKSIKLYILMTFFSFAIPYGLVYLAESSLFGIPSGLAAVLFATYPFFIVILSYFLIPSEIINIFKLTGIIIGFAGIVVIFYEGTNYNFSSYFWGMAGLVLGAFFQALNTVAIKKYGGHLNPLAMNFYPMLFTGIILLIAGFLFEDITNQIFNAPALISIFYLALFGSVITFTSYYWLLKRVNILILSLIAFITPAIALFFGYIFYSEELSFRDFLGCVLVLLGLLFANIGNAKKKQLVQN